VHRGAAGYLPLTVPRKVAKNLLAGARRLRTFPLVVLTVSLVVTVVATYAFDRGITQRDAERFRSAVHSTRDRIEGRLDAYIAALLATRGLFSGDDPVTSGEFRRFVAALELQRLYPGIQGIGLSRRLDASERTRVEQELRAQGHEGFSIWPDGPREEWHTIAFLEPLDRRNQAALGYDMFTEPVRREAMARARDTGMPAASGKVTLIQEVDATKQAGFLIYVPVYDGHGSPANTAERRERLFGFVYAPFRMDDLLAGIFGSEEQPDVAFQILEEADGLLYGTHGRLTHHEQARFRADTTLDLAGRTWVVRVFSQPAFERASSRRLLPLVLAIGIAASAALFVFSLARSRGNEALRLQARVIENMSEGVSVADANGVILYTNPAEDGMFGYARGELVGRPLAVQSALSPEEQAERDAEVARAVHERGMWSGESFTVKKSGETFVTAARITGLEAAGRRYRVRVQEDVTDRKRAEAEREQLLERAQTARAEAEAANIAKDEFLAMLGHELRNPLAPMVTALQILRLKERDRVGGELDILERQMRHVVRLVDDLLEVSRVTRGKVALHPQRLRLATVISKAVEIASPLFEERRHTLDIDVPDELSVDGDEVRLAQVIANLLTNAAKFTERGGRIAIVAERSGGDVLVRVRDNGAGIAPELLPRVFDLFTQGQRTLDRSRGGLGIGLTLVRNLVEAHGGSVSAQSEGLGKGSEFVVRLPAPTTPAAEATPEPDPPRARAAHRARRVLVVDDNEDAAGMLAELLEAVGHDVRVAHDGPEALSVAPGFEPDVALLDIGLPIMDGYELAARLRAQGATRLMAVTGYGQRHDRQRSRDAGFERHFVKPVDSNELLSAIEAA
jgi:PAS domain S-box-containing protein